MKGINDYYVEHLGHSLFLLFGAMALLLLIGCGNVSILLLAQPGSMNWRFARPSEPTRGRIQRQLLTEALALSLLGLLVASY